MASKTISLKLEAYQKLRPARRYPSESFSDVVLRASWPEETITAAEFLRLCLDRGPLLVQDERAPVEELKDAPAPAEDKWKTD